MKLKISVGLCFILMQYSSTQVLEIKTKAKRLTYSLTKIHDL